MPRLQRSPMVLSLLASGAHWLLPNRMAHAFKAGGCPPVNSCEQLLPFHRRAGPQSWQRTLSNKSLRLLSLKFLGDSIETPRAPWTQQLIVNRVPLIASVTTHPRTRRIYGRAVVISAGSLQQSTGRPSSRCRLAQQTRCCSRSDTCGLARAIPYRALRARL